MLFRAAALALLQSCSTAIPKGIKPVADFDINQYLGCWYEIARLDHRFERGMEQVTATYSLQKDDSICVENTGWKSKKRRKRTVVGRAKLASDKHIGHLKVSFWRPFYGSYVIFHLERDYSVAMVCGASRKYCWLLARKPVLTEEELAKYQKVAQANGFPAEQFIYPPSAVPTASGIDH